MLNTVRLAYILCGKFRQWCIVSLERNPKHFIFQTSSKKGPESGVAFEGKRKLMNRSMLLLAVIATWTVLGCMSLDAPVLSVSDAPGNLSGDATLEYLDIVEARVHREGDLFAFTVSTAAPLPSAQDMAGKRIDFIWSVDADKNLTTGEADNDAGNDFNLHLWLDNAGWHPVIYAVSDVALGRMAPRNPRQPQFRVEGTTLSLLVPASIFPEAEFEWWARSTTEHAPAWEPVTGNPPTRRASTETHREGSIQPGL